MLVTNFINLIHTPPYFEYQFVMTTLHFPVRYSFSVILSNLTFLRVYLLVRVFTTYSRWKNLESEESCEREGFQADFWFAIKSLMKQRPYLSIMFNFSVSVIVFGFAVRSFEMSVREPEMMMDLGLSMRTWCIKTFLLEVQSTLTSAMFGTAFGSLWWQCLQVTTSFTKFCSRFRRSLSYHSLWPLCHCDCKLLGHVLSLSICLCHGDIISLHAFLSESIWAALKVEVARRA